MRLLLAPSLALLATWTWCAEPTSIAEVQLANGSELVAHWKATPWGATWADPALPVYVHDILALPGTLCYPSTLYAHMARPRAPACALADA